MIATMTPRTRDGRILHLLDGECYVVLVSLATGKEISRRVAGRLWVAVSLGSDVSFVFNPDEMDEKNTSTLVATSAAHPAAVRVFLAGEAAITMTTARVDKGSVVTVDWHDNYELMA